MIKLRDDIALPKKVAIALRAFQDEIDKLPSFDERSSNAKTLFSRKNTKKNPVFKEVKQLISEMCNSTRRCVYCEDSLADEVEHIYPKDLFPEKCFSWENYVYACGPCNGPKNNKFAIFSGGSGKLIEVNPPRGETARQPPPGIAALINPRQEDPMKFCILDLSGTFKFVPLESLSPKDRLRAEYTFDKILRLNDVEREPIRRSRENAYDNYKARLNYYVQEKHSRARPSILGKMIGGIKSENHSTVWKEMQRYHDLGILRQVDPELDDLFIKVPEALSW